MSMLAEPREKKKWSTDPRGTNWSKDETKFGLKMLKKMGWSDGKGLGANENGITTHIKVSHKTDNRGVGCSMKEENNWIAHQDDFSSLLSELNNHHAVDIQQKSERSKDSKVTYLEKSSKSQKRVHYQKFTRGKDLSNYKSADMAAIFGKAISQSAPVTPRNLSEAESSDCSSTASCPENKKRKKRKKKKSFKNKQKREDSHIDQEGSNINHTTSTMSVQDYFAQRMAKFKGKNSEVLDPTEKSKTNNVDDDTTDVVVDPLDQQDKKIANGKSKKKKKKRMPVDNEGSGAGESAGVDNTVLKKKKRRNDEEGNQHNSDNVSGFARTGEGKSLKKKRKKDDKSCVIDA